MNRVSPSDPLNRHQIDVLIRRAHRQRAIILKVLLRSLRRFARRRARQVGEHAGRVARHKLGGLMRRRRKAAFTELQKLDDQTLKDIRVRSNGASRSCC